MLRGGPIKQLIRNEFLREFKSFASFGSLLLFAATSTFTAYLSFKKLDSPLLWNGVFWLMILFAGINGCANTFKESREESNYLHTLIFPNEWLISKIAFNAVTLLFMSLLSLLLYSLFLGNQIQNIGLFFLLCIMGSVTFAIILTVASGISYRASGNSALFSVLAIPISIPLLILLIGSSLFALRSINSSDFIEAEIYHEESHQILINELVVSNDSVLIAEDLKGNRRTIKLDAPQTVSDNSKYLATLRFDEANHTLVGTAFSEFEEKSYRNAYGLLLGIVVVGILTLLVAIQIFPKFWNE